MKYRICSRKRLLTQPSHHNVISPGLVSQTSRKPYSWCECSWHSSWEGSLFPKLPTELAEVCTGTIDEDYGGGYTMDSKKPSLDLLASFYNTSENNRVQSSWCDYSLECKFINALKGSMCFASMRLVCYISTYCWQKIYIQILKNIKIIA